MAQDEQQEEHLETGKIEDDAYHLAKLSEMEEWKTAKVLLIKKMFSMASLMDMTVEEVKDPVESLARKRACDLLGEWIAEVGGGTLMHDTITESATTEDEHLINVAG